MSLYKIKPLKWQNDVTYQDGRTAVEGGYYYIEPIADERWEWGYELGYELAGGTVDTIEEAKAACESHRRMLLEAELEPAYQPEELPTEPGLYWFRASRTDSWVFRLVGQRRGQLFAQIAAGHTYCPNEGQWARIPEPEVER